MRNDQVPKARRCAWRLRAHTTRRSPDGKALGAVAGELVACAGRVARQLGVHIVLRRGEGLQAERLEIRCHGDTR